MNRSDIFILKLAKSVSRVEKFKIFELPSKMIAMENDNSNKTI